MWFEDVVFFAAAIGALAGAVGVVVLRNPFYSVLSLVAHLVALAVLFLLLRAQFVAAGQVVVYAGAVMVLYVFVVAYIGGSDEPLRPDESLITSFGPIFALALGVELCFAFLGSGLTAIDSRGAELGAGYGTPGQIGEALLTKFLIAFEAASFLLLVAAVGAVVLARRRRGLEDGGAWPVASRMLTESAKPPPTGPRGAGAATGAGTTGASAAGAVERREA